MCSLKLHFYNCYGLTGYSVVYLALLFLVLMFKGVNSYREYQCDNYELVTGFTVKYINWDACYIKDSSGRYIRYDHHYKDIK